MSPKELLEIKEGVYHLSGGTKNPAVDRRYRADWRHEDTFRSGLFKISFYEEEDVFKDKPTRIRREITINRVNWNYSMRATVSFPKDGDGDVRASFSGDEKQKKSFKNLVDALVPEEALEAILAATDIFVLRMALALLVKEEIATKEQVLERLRRDS